MNFGNTDLNSHFGEHGPVTPAFAVLEALRNNEFERAWQFWAPSYRRDAAELWVQTNYATLQNYQDRTAAEMIDVLASTDDPACLKGRDSELWDAFRYTQLYSAHEALGSCFELLAEDRLGAASNTRVLAPDTELVILLECDPASPQVFHEPTEVKAVQVTLQLVNRKWMVVNLDSSL